MRNGEHRHMSKANLALWALMIVRRQCHFFFFLFHYLRHLQQQKQTNLDSPPWNLKLEDAPPSTRSVKPVSEAAMPQFPSYGPGPGYPYPSYPFFPPHGYPLVPPSVPLPPEAPAESASVDPTLFPFIRDWLKSLDNGPRGADGHVFSQYIQRFEENGIQRVFEIADPNLFSRADIIAICPGMKIGTANLVLMYAREDAEAIRSEEQKRAKRIRYY
jgi:hypothetical protein